MFKLCIALAFLAVAASEPLVYSSLGEFGPYPAAAAYPINYGYNYNAPLVNTYPGPLLAKSVIAAPAHISPLAYHGLAPAPVISYNAGLPIVVKK